jgi:hypothetical protein
MPSPTAFPFQGKTKILKLKRCQNQKCPIDTTASSLFIAVYSASAWMRTCLLFRIFKKCNSPIEIILEQESRSLATVLAQLPTSQKTMTEKKPPLNPSKLRMPLRRITNFLPPSSLIPSKRCTNQMNRKENSARRTSNDNKYLNALQDQ